MGSGPGGRLATMVANECRKGQNRRADEEEPMDLSDREFWTFVHGMVLGSLFLLAFSGGLAGLYSYRPE